MQRLVSDLQLEMGKPVVYMDNQGAMKLAKNPEFHKRTKHIQVRYHFIREKFESGLFQLSYVNTNDQIADICTKPLLKEKFQRFRSLMGMCKF